MANNALATRSDGELTENEHAALMEQVIVHNDLSKLSPAQRVNYYRQKAESMGLDWTRQPMQYITLQGRLTLYLTAAGTSQLRSINRIDIEDPTVQQVGDLYVVTVKGRSPSGRTDTEIGAVNITGLKGEALANAMMKALTKAKRRLTISITGAGMLDESEVESVPGARRVTVTADGEIVEQVRALPEPSPATTQQTEESLVEGIGGEELEEPEEADDDTGGNPLSDYLMALQRATTVKEINDLHKGLLATINRGDLSLTEQEHNEVYEAYNERRGKLRQARS